MQKNSNLRSSTIIIGIDPGSKRIGYGIIEKTGSRLKFVDAGLLGISVETKQGTLIETKKHLETLIKKFNPSLLAVEKLYFSKNQKTALSVSENRGVIILVASENNLQIQEYSPNEVKQSVTGYGLADKKAVFKMVKIILNKPDLKIIDDASDALALAIIASQKSNILRC